MRIPRQEDVALLFLCELAENYGKRIVPLSQVAVTHRISILFLKKIARALRRAGLVISKEGMSGGYQLATHPDNISVWDAIKALESDQNHAPHVVSIRSRCPLNEFCLPDAIHQTLVRSQEATLDNIRLSSFLHTH